MHGFHYRDSKLLDTSVHYTEYVAVINKSPENMHDILLAIAVHLNTGAFIKKYELLFVNVIIDIEIPLYISV